MFRFYRNNLKTLPQAPLSMAGNTVVISKSPTRGARRG